MTNEPRYYNLFDPSKKYYGIRALAGFPPQSREFNEMQSTLLYVIQGLGDSLRKNGSITEGGQFFRNADNANLLAMQAAKVYYNGIVHDIPAATVALVGAGIESVGVLFTEEVVTYLEDGSLVDPSAGSPNKGKRGANRLKVTGQWVLISASTPGAVPFYTFRDGQEVVQPSIGAIDPVVKMAARRQYDVDGNFVVTGFDLRAENFTDSEIALTVGNFTGASAGGGSKAYVRGYEIIKLVSEKVPLPKALDTRRVTGERFTYSPANPNAPTAAEQRMLVGYQPMPATGIKKVEAVFRVTRTVLNHNFNSTDEFPLQANETVVDIASIAGYTKGTNAASPGADYYRVGAQIKWDCPSNNEPTAGAAYDVTALVNRVLDPATYSVYTDATGLTYIDLSGLSEKPDAGSVVEADYDFLLSRIDVVYLDADGVIGIQPGAPAVKPSVPPVSGEVLAIGHILLAPGGDASKATITPYNVKRLTQSDLRSLLERVNRTEYNQAAKDLQTSGLNRVGNAVTTLKGIFTESFTYVASDFENDGVNGISTLKFDRVLGPSVDSMINVAKRELNLPELSDAAPLTVNAIGTGAAFAGHTNSATLGYSKIGDVEAVITQLIATRTMAVNEFAIDTNLPTIEITPQAVDAVEFDKSVLDSLANTNGKSFANLVSRARPDTAAAVAAQLEEANRSGFVQGGRAFIRAGQEIYVRGSFFTPNSEVECTLDGKVVTLNPNLTGVPNNWTLPSPLNQNSTATGLTHRVKTDAKGSFTAKFVVPAGVPTGSRAVVCASSAGDVASTAFEGRGFSVTDDFVRLLSSVTRVASPLPPVIASVTPDHTNLTSPGVVTFSVALSPTGGIAEEVIVTLSDGTAPKVVTVDANTVNVPTGVLSSGVNWTAIARGPGGFSAPFTGTVTYNSLPPNLNPPVITEFGFANGYTIAPSVQQQIPVTWKASGTLKSVRIYSSASSTPVTVTDPASLASGTAKVTIVPGGNTIAIEAVGDGALGISERQQKAVTVPSYPRDPLAETFTLPVGRFVTGLDLFFSQRDPAASVTVQIRDTVNGYPGPNVVGTVSPASKTLPSNLVQVSANGTLATSFVFDDPVWLEGGTEYAIVVLSDSNAYRVFTAKVGERLLTDAANAVVSGASAPVLSAQPRETASGVLFTSSNNAAWTAYQDTDLKFVLKAAQFPSAGSLSITSPETAGSLEFNAVLAPAGKSMTGMYPKVKVFLPQPPTGSTGASNCAVRWYYQINGDGVWQPFEPFTYVDFPQVATAVQIKAKLASGNAAQSPLVVLSGAEIERLYRQPSGSYVTKTINMTEDYRYVRMILKMALPSGTNIRWYVTDNTTSGGSVVWTEVTAAAHAPVLASDGVFYEHERTLDLGAVVGARKQLRVRLDLSASTASDIVKTPRARDLIVIANA